VSLTTTTVLLILC